MAADDLILRGGTVVRTGAPAPEPTTADIAVRVGRISAVSPGIEGTVP